MCGAEADLRKESLRHVVSAPVARLTVLEEFDRVVADPRVIGNCGEELHRLARDDIGVYIELDETAVRVRSRPPQLPSRGVHRQGEQWG